MAGGREEVEDAEIVHAVAQALIPLLARYTSP
jgi:hypothetical protein